MALASWGHISMKFNTDTPIANLDKYVNHIDSRWAQLSDLSLTVITDGIKFLFYINAGGCVAMITLIGTADSVRQLNWPWYVLGSFFTGLVFVGILNFARYHSIEYILKGWQKDVKTFYEGDLDFVEMCSKDNTRVKKTTWIPIFAYFAFGFFIAGGLVGFYNYHQLIKEQPKMAEKLSTDRLEVSGDQKNHVPMKSPVPPTPQPPKQ